jgi:hypothetical protein
MTRPLNSQGNYASIPGAAPPLHVSSNDPGEIADTQISRVHGLDDTLANGVPEPNLERDVSNPDTWGGRPYNEAPGMFDRLQQEAEIGG